MATLEIEVTPELEKRLREQAKRQGLPVSDYVRPALEALVTPDEAVPTASAGEAVLALFEEIWNGIPEEEWQKLPVDLAEQHNQYIYGTPKG